MANSEIDLKNGYRPAIGGAGVTVMQFGGEVIAFCNGVTVTWPSAVAEAVAVQPMDAIRPLEIVTARAIGMGTISLTLTNLYNQQIWDRLGGGKIAGGDDLADIFQQVELEYGGGGLTVQRVIQPPVKNGKIYIESFQGCVITNVADGQSITSASMLVDRTISISFTRHKRESGNWWKGGAKVKSTPSTLIPTDELAALIKAFAGPEGK